MSEFIVDPASQIGVSPDTEVDFQPGSHQLKGEYINAHYLGHDEAEFLYKCANDAGRGIDLINWIIKDAGFTRDSFSTEYFKKDMKTQRNLRAMTKSYDALFETLTVNLAQTFNDQKSAALRERFPSIRSWLGGDENWHNTAQRAQRNASAHRATVRPVFKDHEHDPTRRLDFYPADFWDNIHKWLPPLLEELNDLVAILHRDLPSIPPKSPPLPATYGQSLVEIATKDAKERAGKLAKSSKDVRFWYLHALAKTGTSIKDWHFRIGKSSSKFGLWLTRTTTQWKTREETYALKKLEDWDRRNPASEWQQEDPRSGDRVVGDWDQDCMTG